MYKPEIGHRAGRKRVVAALHKSKKEKKLLTMSLSKIFFFLQNSDTKDQIFAQSKSMFGHNCDIEVMYKMI